MNNTILPYQKWNLLASSSDKCNYFQSLDFYNVVRETKNYMPIVYFHGKNDDTITGVLLGVLIKEDFKILSYFSSRAVVFSEPCVTDGSLQSYNDLLGKFVNASKGKAVLTEFRFVASTAEEQLKSLFEKWGFKCFDHLNILIDLIQSEEVLWKNVEKRRRREINSGLKHGFTFDEIKDDIDLKQGYAILQELYKRIKKPLFDYSFFLSARNSKHFVFFGLYEESKLVGVKIMILFRNRAYALYGASRQQYQKHFSNATMDWMSILEVKKRGFEIYDWGGAGRPDEEYGVREYKKRFGGELISVNRFIRINSPIGYKLSKIGLKFLSQFK